MKCGRIVVPSDAVDGLTKGDMMYYAAAVGMASAATGGTVTNAGGYRIHTFKLADTGTNFAPTAAGSVDVLIVGGGGGGGGGYNCGGGGAGGFRYITGVAVTAQNYAITVGDGGAGGTNSATASLGPGTNGQNSVALGYTAAGGGGGGGSRNAGSPYADGKAGGSGGGALFAGSVGAGNTPSTTPVQGYAGGLADNASGYGGGGGGGASQLGAASGGGSGVGGKGGDGSSNSITGSPVTYAGGGGGAGNGTAGAGGSGGGGVGSDRDNATGPGNGTDDLGGGGGAGAPECNGGVGGTGGSGIVIIRYLFPRIPSGWRRLAIGTSGQTLKVSAEGIPAWTT